MVPQFHLSAGYPLKFTVFVTILNPQSAPNVSPQNKMLSPMIALATTIIRLSVVSASDSKVLESKYIYICNFLVKMMKEDTQ